MKSITIAGYDLLRPCRDALEKLVRLWIKELAAMLLPIWLILNAGQEIFVNGYFLLLLL